MKLMTMMAALSVAAMAFGNDAAAPQAPAKAPAKAHEARPPRAPAGEMAHRRMAMRDPSMMQDPILRALTNPRIADKIGLSEDQKAKLAIPEDVRNQNRELQKKIGEATRKQMELLRADTPDEKAILAAIDEVFDLRKEQAKAMTKRMIALRAILTPDQLAKIREEMTSSMPHRGPKAEPAKFAPAAKAEPAKAEPTKAVPAKAEAK